jgi:hypothetical protein
MDESRTVPTNAVERFGALIERVVGVLLGNCAYRALSGIPAIQLQNAENSRDVSCPRDEIRQIQAHAERSRSL